MHRALLQIFRLLVLAFAAALAARTNAVAEGEIIDSIEGEKLYLQLCASCHGESGDPSNTNMPFLNPQPSDLRQETLRYGDSWEEVRASIAEGKGDSMLAFESRLSSRQIDAVPNYVLGLRR